MAKSRKSPKKVTRKSPKAKATRKSTKKVTRKSVKKSATKKVKSCTRQTTSKYLSRPSPPYPANECCGEEFEGNDGNMYISKIDKNGICKWVKVN